MLVLVLLGGLVCALAVALVDDPETAFDETDLPVNVACLRVPNMNLMLPADNPSISAIPCCRVREGISSCAPRTGTSAKAETPTSSRKPPLFVSNLKSTAGIGTRWPTQIQSYPDDLIRAHDLPLEG